jgi:hypothetical protein
MALGDARRASGKAMESARRAIGQANEAERRSIGAAMEASRRGTTVDDINAVVAPSRPAKTLPEVQSRGAVPATTGSADFKPKATPSAGRGGGIASPLTEKTKVVDGKTLPDREYWTGGLPSSDGLLIYPAVKTFNFTDATGAAVQLQLADPSEE